MTKISYKIVSTGEVFSNYIDAIKAGFNSEYDETIFTEYFDCNLESVE